MNGNVSFDDIIDALVRHRDYTKGLERELKRKSKECDDWHEIAEPGWKEREAIAHLDGEIRLMHQ